MLIQVLLPTQSNSRDKSTLIGVVSFFFLIFLKPTEQYVHIDVIGLKLGNWGGFFFYIQRQGSLDPSKPVRKEVNFRKWEKSPHRWKEGLGIEL